MRTLTILPIMKLTDKTHSVQNGFTNVPNTCTHIHSDPPPLNYRTQPTIVLSGQNSVMYYFYDLLQSSEESRKTPLV